MSRATLLARIEALLVEFQHIGDAMNAMVQRLEACQDAVVPDLEVGELDFDFDFDFEDSDEAPQSEAQQQYQRASEDLDATLTRAKRLFLQGGRVLAQQHREVKAIAQRGSWTEAYDALQKLLENANAILSRQPWVEERQRSLATVTAAAAITVAHPSGGQTWGARIGILLQNANQKAKAAEYSAAAKTLKEAFELAENANNDETVKQAQEAVKQARSTNITEMTAQVPPHGPPTKTQLTEMKRRATAEMGTLSKQSTEAGTDPEAPGRRPMSNPAGCKALFKKHDWFKLKAMFHNAADPEVNGIPEITTDVMWDLWRYRKKYVDDAFDRLRGTYPTLITKASGSVNLESDIDVTFASPGSGDDVAAAAKFNADILKQFGKPPGRTFDVNIYPRDYRAIKESFNTDYYLKPVKDTDIAQPTGALLKLSRVDQDVATLLKQRRFLDDSSFERLKQTILKKISDEEIRKDTEKRFEEADAIYLITVREKVDAILQQPRVASALKAPEEDSALEDLAELVDSYNALINTGNAAQTPAQLAMMQALLPPLLTQLENNLPALVMEVTDAAYLERMGSLRSTQATIATLEADQPLPEGHPLAESEALHAGSGADRWRKETLNSMKARAKRQLFENIIFANEAYMSEGAIEHIVAGGQAKKSDPKVGEKILAGLTPSTLMQSCNEQLADFFKDMKAYETALSEVADPDDRRREVGEAFVHASKYLVRLLDGAQLLYEKYQKANEEFELSLVRRAPADKSMAAKTGEVNTPADLLVLVKQLLYELRGSDQVPQAVKGELGFAEVEAIFGVQDIPSFRALLEDFAVELNTKVRESSMFQTEQVVSSTNQAAYYGVPLPSGKLAELLREYNEALKGRLKRPLLLLLTDLRPYGKGQPKETVEVSHQAEVARAIKALEARYAELSDERNALQAKLSGWDLALDEELKKDPAELTLSDKFEALKVINLADFDVVEADDWVAEAQHADADLAGALHTEVNALKGKIDRLQAQVDAIH